MFCPNCGTSNEDAAPRCKQCGFELQQAKPAAPKFKGTMMLGQSPFAAQPAGDGTKPGGSPAGGAAPGGAGPSRAALKGTMVGVAPPAVGSAAPPAGTGAGAGAEPRPAPARPAMKGTMIGLAPPGMAPPGMGAPAAGSPGPVATGPAAATPGAGQAGTPAAQASAGQVPSKLKGTMIGVAPPDLGGQGASAGTAATMVMPSQAPAPGAGAGLGAGAPSPTPGAPPGLARTEVIPAMATGASPVNPLGGTVLGSPAPDFGGTAPTAQIPSAQGPGAQGPGAGGQNPSAQGFAQTALSQAAVPPGAGDGAAGQQTAGHDAAAAGYGLGNLAAPGSPAGTSPEAAPPAQGAAGIAHASPGALAPNQGALVAGGAPGPLGKVRNPVVTLLIGMMCFVYALVAYIQMLGELKRFRQKNDLSLLLFFIPIINIIEVLKLPEKVADAQRMVGVQNPQVAHPVLYLFFGLYFFPADLNEVWEAARRNAG